MKKMLASLALVGSLVFVTGCSVPLDTPTRESGYSALEADTVVYKNTKTYTVKRGDTLYKISMLPQFKGKTSWWNIAKANKLRDPYRIYVGQKLRVPVTVSKPKPSPVITPKPTPKPSPTATVKPTPQPSPTPTASPKPSPSPTVTPTPTATPTPTPSPSECSVWSGGGWLTGACPVPSPTKAPTPSQTPTTSAPAPSPTPTETLAAGQMKTGFITGYSMQDNDPQWSKEIAYPKKYGNATIHNEAAGVGSYDDPITLAAEVGDYAPGTRFYLPHVDRYFMLEDSCASCGKRPEWIDMYIGGNQGDSVAKMDECMGSLTGDHTFEVNPPRGRDVVEGPLFNSATDTCYKPTP